jgi:hypothetical protein
MNNSEIPEDVTSPVQKKNPRTRFTEKILKQVIGQERANQALQSLSMGLIPGAHNSAFNLGSKVLSLMNAAIRDRGNFRISKRMLMIYSDDV